MEALTTAATKPKSCWRPQFRLRALLLATVVIGLMLAAVSAWLAPYRVQERAKGEVRQGTSHYRIVSMGSAAESWWESEFFLPTVKIELTGGATDLRVLQGFPFLRQCDVHERQLTAEDLQTLAGLAGLTRLDLSHCQLPEDAIVELARLSNLEVLHVEACGIPEAALDPLRERLPKLEIYDD